METTQKLQKLLAYIAEENNDVTVQQLWMLMYIVNNEGCSQVEIANALDMNEPTVSRIINKFGKRKMRVKNRDGSHSWREGRGYLTKAVADDYDIRRNEIRLTRRGQAFIQGLERILG